MILPSSVSSSSNKETESFDNLTSEVTENSDHESPQGQEIIESSGHVSEVHESQEVAESSHHVSEDQEITFPVSLLSI
jgi:hypothetical protein